MKPKTFDAIIVGAGLAGLSCARRLQTKGVDYFLIEASDRPGGRVKSDVASVSRKNLKRSWNTP